ncbi:hypothetical protein ZEAMMB73_Zm00001d016335 [Zea mays]|uniref:Uncharacterized protein n=1 Tax=Zea mays TaxID=4577 RepID=A0A1D6H6T8_MAIZE|nr:hypothetical protein ZEAMMB73_Zm00001d016335 [Zea mays]
MIILVSAARDDHHSIHSLQRCLIPATSFYKLRMWGNDRQMEFVRDAKILRMNFVIDLLSYEDNSCRYLIPSNIQQRLIDIAKKD